MIFAAGEKKLELLGRLCKEYEVPIIVSSDAHDPSWVGIFDKAVDLIEEEGFDEDIIRNKGRKDKHM